MKTISELAKDYALSYSGMYNRIQSIMRYLREKGDKRAERLIHISELRFPRGKAKMLINDELLEEILRENRIE
jgi:hypothetical protein